MATFTVDGVEYELFTFDRLEDFEMGDLTVLEEHGGLDLAALGDGDVKITSRLVRALILLSMLRVNPDATFADTGRVPLRVLNDLMAASANTSDEGDAAPLPPTLVGEADGVPA